MINFAKNYYPKTYQDFNESSPGMMFIEMASYVGDVLSYYSDQNFRESLLTSAQENVNVIGLSQLFGYKPKVLLAKKDEHYDIDPEKFTSLITSYKDICCHLLMEKVN